MGEYIFYATDSIPENKIPVRPFAEYSGEAGFGFFTGQWGIPELNSGFVPAPWFQGTISAEQDAYGCHISPEAAEGGRLPLSFRADLKAPGKYFLTVTLYSPEDQEEVLLFAGRRQLVFRGGLKGGEEWTGSFPIHVCDIIPRGETVRHKVQSAAVTVIGSSVRLVSISLEPWKGRTLFIAGDSTVTDQSTQYPYAPEASYSGWGQMLPAFLKGAAAVSNHAHSGLTTESFREEGHYEILTEAIGPGDICLFQFGHNDQKLKNLRPEGGYRKNLVRYIDEIRKKVAFPLLVTPLARNSWRGNDGAYNDLLKEYAKEVQRIGEAMAVPVLDLHGKSMAFITEHGLEASKRWFYPSDYTHTNDYGAWKMAGFLWEELLNSGLFSSTGEKPRSWEPPKDFKVFEHFQGRMQAAEPQKERAPETDRPEEVLTRAETLDFIIRAVNYFPINVYNDFFSDVIGHEWYAGIIECAFQNGLIPEEMIQKGCFFPEQAVTLEEFLYMVMTGYKSRKSLDFQRDYTIKGTLPWTREAVTAACALGAAEPEERWRRTLTRGEAAAILYRFGI